jgi:serine protease AprX
MTAGPPDAWFSILVILGMALGLMGPALMPTSNYSAQAHPMVLQIAADAPDQMVSVIVQEAGVSGDAAALVKQLGGRVTKDLHIINAFAAELGAAEAVELASSPTVRWVSLNAPVESTDKGGGGKPVVQEEVPLQPNYYLDTLNVRPVWDMGLLGQGITVAVIDSGTNTEKDLQVDPNKGKSDSRVLEQLTFNSNAGHKNDATGHGTHVAGIVGGSGYRSSGLYAGIAPEVSFVSLKISDDIGMAYESDAVDAMQWVFENKDIYNIRVVNLSVNTTTESSYHTSPLDAAAEILWFNGVVVVVSAGNKGSGNGFNTANAAPANDPFVITVGASLERGTSNRADDQLAPFSASGTTFDGFSKPEIFAPGKDIISILGPEMWIPDHPDRVVMDGEYFRLSGTSMSAPMVTGAVALLLQDEPNLTPDQVKYRLLESASTIGANDLYLDVYAAVTGTTTESANTGYVASQLLWSGDEPIAWNSVAWNSVAWNSVAWNSVAWNSVAWNSVAWNSVAWND